jgi:hypothetical protein
MAELYQITRKVAPQVVGNKLKTRTTKNLNAEFSPLIKENFLEGQSLVGRKSRRAERVQRQTSIPRRI